MSDFFCAYRATMIDEGSYSNDPRDRGGETWKGIARNMHPTWEGWALIDEVKQNVNASQLVKALQQDEELEEMVCKFYEAKFWIPLQLDAIKEQGIASELFDTAVNQGPSTAIRQLQAALNLLNNNQKHYSDINEDGKMGPATLKAYSAYMLTANFPGRSVERNVTTLLKAINGLQFQRYAEICEEKPEQEIYFYGWLNRV